MDAFTPPTNPVEAFKKLAGDPCLDDDCGEVLSPCCQKSILIVSGSLPLICICTGCQKEYRLRDVIQVSG